MKMKKLMAVMLSTMMFAALAGGCSSAKGNNTEQEKDGGNKGEPVVLKVWGGVPPESGYQQMCENFNEAFKDKNIQVEYERYVNDDTGNLKLDTALMAGSDVDLFFNYGLTPLQKRYEGSMTQDLTEFIEKDNYDMVKNFGEFVETTYIDGKVYAMPTTLTQNAILVNKDMFDEAGIEVPKSWTLEEMREIAKKLTKGEGQDKVYGMYWNTGAIMGDLTPTRLSLGGDFMYKEGGKETNFDHPMFKENISLIYDMMDVDGSAPTHVDSVTQKLSIEGMFLQEKAAMTIGSWAVRNIKNTQEYPHDFVTAAVPYPTMEKNAEYWNGELGDLLSISQKSEHKEEAWEFMKWYAQEGMLPVVAGGRVPANLNINLDDVGKAFLDGAEELFDADSIIYAMIQPKEKYWVQTILNKAPEITKIINEEMEAVYIGEKSIDDALASAKARGDEQLK